MRIPCTQCGADVEISETEEFVRCGHCQSSLYVDLKRTVTCAIVRPNVEEKDASLLVERHLFLHQIAGGVTWIGKEFRYLPFWEVKAGDGVHLAPALSLTDSELAKAGPTSGKKEILDPARIGLEHLALPEIYAESVVESMKEKGLLTGEPESMTLVYAPFFDVRYSYQGKEYAAYVDAVGGSVHSDILPPSPVLALDRRFGLLMAAALGIFTSEGILLGMLWGGAAMVVTAIPFYFIARRLLV